MPMRPVVYSVTLGVWLLFTSAAAGAEDKRSRFAADMRALRSLVQEWNSAPHTADETFLERFYIDSGRVARARGPHILHALFHEARHWHDEQIIVYTSLIVQLERHGTERILDFYEKSDPRWHQFIEEIRYECAGHDQGLTESKLDEYAKSHPGSHEFIKHLRYERAQQLREQRRSAKDRSKSVR